MVMAEPSVVGAVIALLCGLGVSVAAIVYRMPSMERRGEFGRDAAQVTRPPKDRDESL